MGIVADLFVVDGGCFEMSEGVRDWRCEASEVVRDRILGYAMVGGCGCAMAGGCG